MDLHLEPILGLVLAILIALAGWFLAARLRFPAPAILGPMILVGAASSVGWVQVALPIWLKPALQIIVGTYLGYRIDRSALGRVRSLTRPAMLVTVWMISSAMLIGYLLAQTIHIDLTTAFLGSSPGGIAEMSAMAISLEGDVILVATLQALRIISTLLTIPMLVRGIDRRVPSGARVKPPLVTEPQGTATIPVKSTSVKPFIYLIVGALGSLLFGAINFPAAGILGPLAAVAALRVSGIDFGSPPILLRSLAQVGLGIVIGAGFTSQTLSELQTQFLPIVLVTVSTVASSLALAQIVQRWTNTDRQTALLACAPGGVSQMGMIADELGADVVIVNVFQLTRLVAAIVILPVVIRLLLGV